MTNPSGDGILFDSQDSGGSGKIACHPRLPLGQQTIFPDPLNPSSQIVSPVTLLISHYLYNTTPNYR